MVLCFRSYDAIVADRWPTRLDMRLPYFHLTTQEFWRGFDAEMRPAASPESCAVCELRPEFFEQLTDASFRLKARLVLVSNYFEPVEQIALFDAGLWSADSDLRVIVNPQRFTEHGPEALRLSSFGGRHLQFDPAAKLCPSLESLHRHRLDCGISYNEGCMKRVTIYTDGACEGNPGPGGWAAILEYGHAVKEFSGGAIATTNNRMEMQAALEGLQRLKEACEVQLYTDSEYLRDGITRWIKAWKAKGWRKKVKNADLWKALDAAAERHAVTWHWVRGHNGNPRNERCDLLATTEAKKISSGYSAEVRAAALEAFLADRKQSLDAVAPPKEPTLL